MFVFIRCLFHTVLPETYSIGKIPVTNGKEISPSLKYMQNIYKFVLCLHQGMEGEY